MDVLKAQAKFHKERCYKLKDPKVIGYYSVNNEREYQLNLENLKYFNEKTELKGTVNLNEGESVKWNLDNVNLFPFNEYLLDHRKIIEESSADDIEDVPVFAERSTLLDIFYMPQNIKPRKVFLAVLYDGCIFLRSVRNPQIQNKELAHQGHRFKQLVLSDEPELEPSADKVIDQNVEFSCVLEMSINNHKIIYSAQVDGIEGSEVKLEDGDESKLFEQLDKAKIVRTMTCAKEFKDKKFRKYTTKRMWGKIYLSKCDKVIVGFKKDMMNVSSISPIDQATILKHKIGWKPEASFQFMDAFFTFIKDSFMKTIVNIPHDSVKDLKPIELFFEKGRKIAEVELCDRPANIGNMKTVRYEYNDFIECLKKLKIKETQSYENAATSAH